MSACAYPPIDFGPFQIPGASLPAVALPLDLLYAYGLAGLGPLSFGPFQIPGASLPAVALPLDLAFFCPLD